MWFILWFPCIRPRSRFVRDTFVLYSKQLTAEVLAILLLASPLAAAAPSEIRFANRQKESGVQFVLDNDPTPDKPVIDSVLGGVALLDYDNDGYLDIFFTNGAS